MKKCIKCGAEKALTEFYINSAHRDGLQSLCKPCDIDAKRKRRIAQYAARPAKIVPTVKKCIKCQEEKTFDEFHRNKNGAYGRTNVCKICVKVYQAEYRNRPGIADRMREYYRTRQIVHAEAIAAAGRVFREIHKERLKRKRQEKYSVYFAVSASRRRAVIKKAVPKWMTDAHWAKIDALYAERDRLTAETGIMHHVDHIVPLQNKKVQGLHVIANLQIITAAENMKKKNVWWPDMWDRD